MSPFDEAMRQHDEVLLEKLQEDIGVSDNVRIFESAEGQLSPITLAESKAAAGEVREAIAHVTTSSS
jgi:hypothetical protein